MADLYQEITEFSGGVQSSAAADRIPLNAMPLAVNTAFKNIGQGIANIGTRPGLVTVNSTALSGSPAPLLNKIYAYESGGTFTNYLAMVTDDGTLRFKNPDDTFTSTLTVPSGFPNPATTCFTAGDFAVDGVVMNNRLFLVNEEGEQRSLLGQTYKPWGLTSVATWSAVSAATGSSAMPDETYSVAITVYDADTGAESAISSTTSVTMGGANRRILVSITPTAAEIAQYPYWRVYLRRDSTQATLYQVSTFENVGGTTIVTDGNIPIGTTSVYLDLSAATISTHTTVAPTQTDNGVPPSDIRYVATFGRRLLACSTRQLYWSQLDKPDSFSAAAFEPIDTGEGDQITGIFPFNDEICLLFTSTATWGIFGNDPLTWTIRPIDHTVGCCSHTSVVEYEGKLAWWSAESGPVFYEGSNITHQGLDDLGWSNVVENIEAERHNRISAGYDPQGQRILWSVATLNTTTRNNRLISYSTRVKRFEASYWDPMDVSALSVGYIAEGTQRLFCSNYAGQLFYFDAGVSIDGVTDGTQLFTFDATDTVMPTITGTGFTTTGAGLTERYVVITDEDNRFISKIRIASNTATVLTLADSLTGVVAGATYTAYIGSPDMRLYTKWLDMGKTFHRKRFDRLYVHAQSTGDASNVYAATQVSFVNESRPPQSIFSISGAQWDSAIWDSSLWAGVGQLKKRLFIGRTSQTMRVTIFHFRSGQDLTIHTIGVLAREQSDRYYGL